MENLGRKRRSNDYSENVIQQFLMKNDHFANLCRSPKGYSVEYELEQDVKDVFWSVATDLRQRLEEHQAAKS